MNVKEAAAKNLLRDMMNGRVSETAKVLDTETALRVILESYGSAISEAERLRSENIQLKARVKILEKDLLDAHSVIGEAYEHRFNIFL